MSVSFPAIVGIVNITADSFSDGGLYLDLAAAVAHAVQLVDDGAAIIDIGAESTHPASQDVPATLQIERLRPIMLALRARNIPVSLDATHPAVLRAIGPLGLAQLNSVTALRDPDSVAALRHLDCKIVLMFSRNAAGDTGRAASDAWKTEPPATNGAPLPSAAAHPPDLLTQLHAFFYHRITALTAAGIARERLILDPGMGFFLGPGTEPSLTVLRNLSVLHSFDLPLYICTSRKSFIGEVLVDERTNQPRPVADRSAGTLATELWAALQGVAFIRTHAVKQLSDALRVLHALRTE